jgi:hypothetical protein
MANQFKFNHQSPNVLVSIQLQDIHYTWLKSFHSYHVSFQPVEYYTVIRQLLDSMYSFIHTPVVPSRHPPFSRKNYGPQIQIARFR